MKLRIAEFLHIEKTKAKPKAKFSSLKNIRNNVIGLFHSNSSDDNIIDMDIKMLKDIGYSENKESKEDIAKNYYLF